MAIKYKKKKHKQNNFIHTVITVILLYGVLLSVIDFLYDTAEADAYEDLHVQTKQIKDDITLQLLSDRENLETMASFAAKLHRDGEHYDIMFESFKPIGLIENIGILTPDNLFVTKAGSINLDGKIDFADEAERGKYVSGRVRDLTREEEYELIRSAVPIKVNDEVVGMLYGVIRLDKIAEKYNNMARELDAQLFVYDAEEGNLVIDTVHNELGNISFLKDRKYNNGYSYEQMMATDKGFTAFESAYRRENLHLHYSTIEDIGWMIALGRYDSQVFASTRELTGVLVLGFVGILLIISIYMLVLNSSEKRVNNVTACAAMVRKELLETTGDSNSISDAMKLVCDFAGSRSAVLFDTDGNEYKHISAEDNSNILSVDDRKYFRTQLFRYSAEIHKITGNTFNIICIKPGRHLKKTNRDLYEFLKNQKISSVSFSATVNDADRIRVLAAVNAKRIKATLMLAEEISACFAMALYNKDHLDKTTIAATTDSLTGVFNRVAYKNDVAELEKENTQSLACVYIDVNELHMCNNKYGHAAGDEMLLYIANSLSTVFEGQRVYRMGGDEFLVFCRGIEYESVKNAIAKLDECLKPRSYHVAIGMSYRTQNMNVDDMIREAEVRMYEAKALYYQNKEQTSKATKEKEFVQAKTGIVEIDTMISILKENYNGIYRVSLDTDRARRILMPAYLKYNENEEHYSTLFSKYVSESVEPGFHRALLSFLNYDAIRHQLSQGNVPKIRYKKNSGENVILSIYKLCDPEESVSDTLWVFAKE